jgi:mannose-6-phosphate isomerase
MKLERRYVEKPWGRTQLPATFGSTTGKRIGEIWFTGAGDQELLVKYLFTSERLSIQVHPSDEEARARGLPRGKSECWYILDAEPGATLGLGLKREVSRDELRAAALDGSIEELIDWRPVVRGDFYTVPSGTIHAIGGGISLLEIQQNADVTYRLYDYGRPRVLHLDDAIAVARAGPYTNALAQHLSGDGQATLVDGPHFVVLQTTDGHALEDQLRWAIPLDGAVHTKDERASAGDCLLLQPGEAVDSDGPMLIAVTK